MPLVEQSALSINYWEKWQFSISWGLHFKMDFLYISAKQKKKQFNTTVIERNCVASEYIIWWHRHFYSLGFPSLWKKSQQKLVAFYFYTVSVYIMNFENLLFRQKNVWEVLNLLHTSEKREMTFGILKKIIIINYSDSWKT